LKISNVSTNVYVEVIQILSKKDKEKSLKNQTEGFMYLLRLKTVQILEGEMHVFVPLSMKQKTSQKFEK